MNKKDNIKDGRVFLCILASVQTSRAENLPKPKPYWQNWFTEPAQLMPRALDFSYNHDLAAK